MAETWRYRGQEIDGVQVFLREFIAAHPTSSRWKLSRQLCEALSWKQPNGVLRDVVCRGLLLMLERAGQIQLPPGPERTPLPHPGQSRRERSRPQAFLIDTTPTVMPLNELRPIDIQLVRRTADEPLFQSLMEEHHYLGYEQPVGEHLKYLIWAQGRPVACKVWSSLRAAIQTLGHVTELVSQQETTLAALRQLLCPASTEKTAKVLEQTGLQSKENSRGGQRGETLGEVYRYDDQARGMSPEERLRFHQEHSGPVMEKLHSWLDAQFQERKVEPNSGLGKAITYLLKDWEKLTLFLRKAGAPLDNNIVERALKKAIRHRKNSLVYKTQKGAAMGDLFMSLIHTCELNGVNPFDYLTELQRRAEDMKQNPAAWMPWNYRDNLAQTATRAASG